jgi:2-phospho-L-lactate transferase/gluconeogenesis factor (CofD/UPF0052 family)
VKVYVCNLMTQANESLGLSASQHIEAIYQHAGRAIFDYAVINTASVSRELQAKYALEAATQIIFDREAVEGLGVRPVTGHYLLEESGMARHATERVALDLMNLFLETSFQRAAKSATVQ